MRIYVSGPMTGLPKNNIPAFNRAAKKLRSLGYVVINPAELDAGEPCNTWEDCLRRDIKWLVTCDAVVNLPGWQKSRGANLENHIAEKLSFDIYTIDQFLAMEKLRRAK